MFGFTSFSQTSFSDDNVIHVAFSVTGVEGTGEVGAVTVAASAVASITNPGYAVGEVGEVSIVGTANLTPTGVQGVGEVGAVTPTGAAVFSVTGVEGIGEIGDDLTFTSIYHVEGVEGVGEIGSVVVSANASVTTGSVEGIGIIDNQYTVFGGTGITVPVFGVEGIGVTGSVTVSASAVVSVQGVEGIGELGSPTVWGHIIPDIPTFYNPVAPVTSGAWDPITPEVDTVYEEDVY